MSTATAIGKVRRPVRITSREERRAPLTSAPAVVQQREQLDPSGEDLVKSSTHLIRTVRAPEQGREKHQEKDVLRMVARFLMEYGKEYPQAEVLELLRCFTGCSQGAAEEALQVLLLHEVVTAVNGVIRGTW